jgi:hypothetical protein
MASTLRGAALAAPKIAPAIFCCSLSAGLPATPFLFVHQVFSVLSTW